jgi:hypothetical protein
MGQRMRGTTSPIATSAGVRVSHLGRQSFIQAILNRPRAKSDLLVVSIILCHPGNKKMCWFIGTANSTMNLTLLHTGLLDYYRKEDVLVVG